MHVTKKCIFMWFLSFFALNFGIGLLSSPGTAPPHEMFCYKRLSVLLLIPAIFLWVWTMPVGQSRPHSEWKDGRQVVSPVLYGADDSCPPERTDISQYLGDSYSPWGKTWKTLFNETTLLWIFSQSEYWFFRRSPEPERSALCKPSLPVALRKLLI